MGNFEHKQNTYIERRNQGRNLTGMMVIEHQELVTMQPLLGWAHLGAVFQ